MSQRTTVRAGNGTGIRHRGKVQNVGHGTRRGVGRIAVAPAATRIAVALLAALVMAGTGCTATGGRAGNSSGSGPGVTGKITVLAAASLTESFTQIGRDFEAANPGISVTFSFGASSTLAQQIRSGAPADVFAAASQTTMDIVTRAGSAGGTPAVFARNRLVMAVGKGNPRHLTSLADLAKPGVKTALCAEQVPCGAAAKQVLAAAQVAVTPVTLEPTVKAALAKVALGEVDAALVYRTDIPAGGAVATAAPGSNAARVEAMEFPESTLSINEYPIVTVKGSAHPAASTAFVTYVLGGQARAALAGAGFQVS